MIVSTEIEVETDGIVRETLIDNVGSIYTRILEEGDTFYDLGEQSSIVLKKKEHGNCTIDIETTPYGGLIKERKMNMISNNDAVEALSMAVFGMRSNPYREITLPTMWATNKVENTNWKFKSASDVDINWKDIKDTLTYAEPLAIVTRKYSGTYEGETRYVVVSKQLMDKAHVLNKVYRTSPTIVSTVEKRVFEIDNNFSDWVDWAKAVKAAKWPDGVKSTINVVLPTV